MIAKKAPSSEKPKFFTHMTDILDRYLKAGEYVHLNENGESSYFVRLQTELDEMKDKLNPGEFYNYKIAIEKKADELETFFRAEEELASTATQLADIFSMLGAYSSDVLRIDTHAILKEFSLHMEKKANFFADIAKSSQDRSRTVRDKVEALKTSVQTWGEWVRAKAQSVVAVAQQRVMVIADAGVLGTVYSWGRSAVETTASTITAIAVRFASSQRAEPEVAKKPQGLLQQL